MYNRIKQVFAALTANITPADKKYVNEHLIGAEQALFWGMNLPDQRHVLNVAYTAEQLAEYEANIDHKLLIKCALLHDVGKVKGDVSTLDKIITVVGHKVFPGWARQWGRLGRGNMIDNLRHAFYIYFNHAKRSARMLADIGASPRVVEIVARHHSARAASDPRELLILRKSDDLH